MTDKANIDDLSEEIKDKAEILAKILISGNRAEIVPCKDGIKILNVERKQII
jgi:hypothetical protein